MNRIEYMRKLASLLQDVPAEERVATMQYYNDYFDDAGEENEEKVIEELGSPEQVAAEMKAGLGRQTENFGEFRETGYTDTQFEKKEVPVRYPRAERQNTGNPYSNGGYAGSQGRSSGSTSYAGGRANGSYTENPSGNGYQYGAGQNGNGYQYSEPDSGQSQKREPWTSSGLKMVLVILIILVVAPVLIPVALAVVCCIFAFGIAGFAIFIALAAVAVALAISGLVLFVRGMFMMISNPAAAVVVMGVGMILGVIGMVATVAAVRLCMIVLPGLFRFTVDLCRRPFQKRRKVA